ncbi:MAG: hypothetical protein ACRDNP_13865 [Gaiellaceae bacterium]
MLDVDAQDLFEVATAEDQYVVETLRSDGLRGTSRSDSCARRSGSPCGDEVRHIGIGGIEDRFWVWVHYAATKLGRGELFECLDVYNYFRAAVFGPLLAVEHDQRPQRVRRLERYAGDALAELEQTVGNHSRDGCLRALRVSIRLYQRLRQNADDQSLVRRAEAEAASLDYLEEIAASND